MILLVALAAATELPTPPAAPEPLAEDCAHSIPIVIGRAPVGLLDAAGKATCSGVVLATGDAADLLRIETWGRAVYDVARIDAAACAAAAVDSGQRETYWRELAARPVPLLSRPGVALGIGVGIGAAVVLLSAVAVRWASEVPVTEQ